MAVVPGRPAAGGIFAVQGVMMVMVVRRRGVRAGRVQVPGDGVASARTPPGQLVAGSRRRRQYGACTGLHVAPARGITVLLHPDDDDVPLALRPIRRPPVARAAARPRSAAVGPATGDGTAPGDDLLPATRLTPEVAVVDLHPEVEAPPATADVLLLLLLLFRHPLLPNGGTSRPVRFLGPAPRDLLVETLRILIRRALPQLVYWLEAA